MKHAMFHKTGLAVAAALALFSVAPEAPAQLTRGCNLPANFPCPTARIMAFSADRTSIEPGDPVTLSWVVENPSTIEITPDVGVVIARGSHKLTPPATTTYTLTATGGPDGQVLTQELTVDVAGTTPRAVAASAEPRAVPRTADGRPLLQGVYNMFGMRGGFGGFGGRPGGTPAPGELPSAPTLRPGMEAYLAPKVDPKVTVSDCTIGAAPPSLGPYSVQFIQNEDFVVILYEYMHLHRIVPLDGQPHEPGISWMGDSVGSWDGDTLVIDTIGFNTLSTVGVGGDRHLPYYHSEELHMVERITRVDYDTLEWETIMEDPKVFVSPWRTVRRLKFHPELRKIEEYQCAENLKDYTYLEPDAAGANTVSTGTN